MAFPSHEYASLEALDVREFALSDPRGFLAQFPEGAILDEVQRAPQILSYLQGLVDSRPKNGSWILTGSQNFALVEGITQSLAGRTAVLHLLPPSYDELRRFPSTPSDAFGALFAGAYPRIFEQGIPPGDFHSSYLATYVERDVRQVVNVGDLSAFQTFLKLCAGRSGQLVNLSALGADAGVSHHTAKAWLSVLEAGFVVFRLPPFHANVGKRLVKTQKIYFVDSGLLSFLIGIREPEQLVSHPLRGAVFETWVVSEVLKARLHAGLPPDLCFYRDTQGNEVDLVLEKGDSLSLMEIKSGATISSDFFSGFDAFASAFGKKAPAGMKRYVVYGGAREERRAAARVLPWNRVDSFE
jgi:predicted AAA+ superfamily ATPase